MVFGFFKQEKPPFPDIPIPTEEDKQQEQVMRYYDQIIHVKQAYDLDAQGKGADLAFFVDHANQLIQNFYYWRARIAEEAALEDLKADKKAEEIRQMEAQLEQLPPLPPEPEQAPTLSVDPAVAHAKKVFEYGEDETPKRTELRERYKVFLDKNLPAVIQEEIDEAFAILLQIAV